MAKFSLLNIAIAITSLMTLASAFSTAPPFRLIVQPTNYSGPTLYLLKDGTATTDFYSAAECWVSWTSQLFCGDFNNAVGIPSDKNNSVLAACIASGSTTCTTGGWSIVQDSTPVIKLTWPGHDFAYDTATKTTYLATSGASVADEGSVQHALLVCGF